MIGTFRLRLRAAYNRPLLREGGWVAGGQLLTAVGALAGIRALTEVVPTAVYGGTSLLLGIATLGASLIGTPVLQTTLRLHADAERGGWLPALRSEIRSLLLRGTGAFILLAMAIGVVLAWTNIVSLAIVALVVALMVLEIARGYEQVFLTAARRQKPYALWMLSDTWVRAFAGPLGAIVLEPSASAVLLGHVVGSAAVYLYFHRVTNPQHSTLGENAPSSLPSDIRSYALPLVPLAVVAWVSALSDRYFVAGMLGLESAGLYAAAYGVVGRPFSLISLSVLNTVRPVYFGFVARAEGANERRARRIWLRGTWALFACLALIIMIFRQPIVWLLLPPQYQSCAELLPWLAAGFVVLAVAQVYGTVNLALKRAWAVSAAEAIGAAASIAIAIPMIHFKGLAGAAMAVPMYYSVQLLAARYFARSASIVLPAPVRAP